MAKGDPRLGGSGTGYFPAIYQSALAQTAEDYDKIMSNYDAAAESIRNKKNSPLTPQTAEYQPGSDYGELKDIAATGGFSGSNIADIRERGISPIRSVYANADREMNRQKNLSGGYAPNMPAAKAKMARDMSSLISGQTTNINAGIGEAIQRGKLAGATALAPLQARENEMRNNFNMNNTNTANQFTLANAQRDDNDFNNILDTIRGQQSLFGTTPAMMSTVGNQVLSAGNLANNLPPVQRGSIGGLPNTMQPVTNQPRIGKPLGRNFG